MAAAGTGDDRVELVEVEYAGAWYAAELRHRTRDPDGAESAHVALHRGTGTFLDTVPASRVRPRPSTPDPRL